MHQVGHKWLPLICRLNSAFWDVVQCRTVALEKAAYFVCHPSISDAFVFFEFEGFFFQCVYGISVFTYSMENKPAALA